VRLQEESDVALHREAAQAATRRAAVLEKRLREVEGRERQAEGKQARAGLPSFAPVLFARPP
jgi:hypothetical protein